MRTHPFPQTRQPKTSGKTILSGLAITALLVQSALAAQTTFDVQVTGAPAGATDIELIFTGTGGSVANRAAVSPAVQDFTGSPANGITATFAATAANDTYEATFLCDFSQVSFASGTWTGVPPPAGDQAGTVAIASANVKLKAVPETASTCLLLSCGLVGLSAGGWRRRRG